MKMYREINGVFYAKIDGTLKEYEYPQHDSSIHSKLQHYHGVRYSNPDIGNFFAWNKKIGDCEIDSLIYTNGKLTQYGEVKTTIKNKITKGRVKKAIGDLTEARMYLPPNCEAIPTFITNKMIDKNMVKLLKVNYIIPIVYLEEEAFNSL